MKNYVALFTLLLITYGIHAQQNIGIGTSSPHVSALLDLTSTSKGLLAPRMTHAQRIAIGSPASGLIVYQTNTVGIETPGLYIHNGSAWKRMARAEEAGGSSSWTISGDNQYSTVDGNVGIGVTSGISEKLFVNGDVFINAPGGPIGDELNVAELKLRGSNIGGSQVSFHKPDSSIVGTVGYAALGNVLNIRHNEAPWQMRFYKSGKIGIGTGILNDTAHSTLHIKEGDFANLTTRHGFLMLGIKSGENIVIGDYEILARNNGQISPLYLQHEGGIVRIGSGTIADGAKLQVTNGVSAGLTTHGYFVLGNTSSTSIAMDNNSIQARNNGAASELQLQGNGGSLSVLGPSFVVASNFFVGIGISSPNERLHVNGSQLLTGNSSTIQFENVNFVDKAFVQISGDNMRIGTNSGNTNGKFIIRNNGGDRVFVDANGNVGIGVNPLSTQKLAVGGKIICEEVKVEMQIDWPDYVFDDQYALTSLDDLEAFIAEHNHLPGIPTASDVRKDGFELGEMNRKLLEKVEELTLYVIELKKEIELMKSN